MRLIRICISEFWTSKHCAIESPGGESDIVAGCDSGPKQRPPSPPTRLKDETRLKADFVSKENIAQSADSNLEADAELNFAREIHLQQSTAVHRRSLSLSGYPSMSTKNGSTSNRALTATILEHVGGAFRKPAPFPNPFKEETHVAPSAAAIPKKPAQKERSILAKFRSESVSSALDSEEGRNQTKEQQDPNPQQERRSFRLRNLFDVARRPSLGSPPSPSSATQHPPKLGTTVASKIKKPRQSSLESSKKSIATETAADLAAKAAGRQQTVFYVHRRPAPPPPPSASPPVLQRPSKRTSPLVQAPRTDKEKEDHEYYYFSPATLASPTFGGTLNESRSISSLLQEAAAAEERQQAALDTPTMARRRLLTFKPGSPTGNEEDATPTTSSAETTLERKLNMKTAASLQTLPADSRQR